MKKRYVFGLMGGFLAGIGGLWAQSSQYQRDLQTSFPMQAQGGWQASQTPRSSIPKGTLKVLRPFHATPTPYKSRFYPLQLPTPAAPAKNPKAVSKLPPGPVTVLGPRRLKYHTLYENPTPTGPRSAPSP